MLLDFVGRFLEKDKRVRDFSIVDSNHIGGPLLKTHVQHQCDDRHVRQNSDLSTIVEYSLCSDFIWDFRVFEDVVEIPPTRMEGSDRSSSS